MQLQNMYSAPLMWVFFMSKAKQRNFISLRLVVKKKLDFIKIAMQYQITPYLNKRIFLLFNREK